MIERRGFLASLLAGLPGAFSLWKRPKADRRRAESESESGSENDHSAPSPIYWVRDDSVSPGILRRRYEFRLFRTIEGRDWPSVSRSLDRCVGRLNDRPFLGHRIGTVLLDSWAMEHVGDSRKVTLNLTRDSLGWNNIVVPSLRGDGGGYQTATVSGPNGGLMYPHADLTEFECWEAETNRGRGRDPHHNLPYEVMDITMAGKPPVIVWRCSRSESEAIEAGWRANNNGPWWFKG